MQEQEEALKTPVRPWIISTDKNCKNSFQELQKYPIPKEPIRYPRNTDLTETNHAYRSTFHDLIHLNMKVLLPNIEIGYYYNHSSQEIEEWINKTKEYIDVLNRNIKKKCNAQMCKLIRIRQQEQRIKDFDMNKLNNLPEDIVRYIHGFLIPETKITLLLARYPTYPKMLEKITSGNLKKYLHCINNTYRQKVFEYDLRQPDRHTCVQNIQPFYVTYSKKQDAIKQIVDLFDKIRNAIPKTPEFYRYYQNYAVRLLQSMIYVSNKISLRRNTKRPRQAEQVVST
jgi:hypothetical protein